MTASLTKIQRAKRDKNLTARQVSQKKYYDKNYRSIKSRHNLWHHMFIGNLPIERLYKVYGITP